MKYISFTVLLFLASFRLVWAQAPAKVDSVKPLFGKTGVMKPSTKNDTWFLQSEPEKHTIIDSTIFKIHYYNVAQRDGAEYSNAGNTGSATYPLVFQPSKTIGFNLGYNQYDIYRFVRDSVKYYQVIRPYTELTMMIGLKGEQFFQGRFANQHKGIVYYGVDFRRIASKGIYGNNATNNNGFSLYGIFNSKNKHWNIQADLLFNSFKMQENGGTAPDIFDSVYFRKELVDVNLTLAQNNYRQVDFYLKSSYNAGKEMEYSVNDSTKEKTFVPIFRISYQFNIERNKNKFRDYDPSSIYYGRFSPINDSVFNDLNYLKLGNTISLDFFARGKFTDSSYQEKNFVAGAEVGYDYYFVNQNLIKSGEDNLHVSGFIRSNNASVSNLFYRGSVTYYLYGYNQHDFLADARIGYDFRKAGRLTATASYQLKEAPYIFERYTSHPAVWNFSLPKTKVLSFGFKYDNSKIGLVADANYYLADHLPVAPGWSVPYVTTSVENILVTHIGNRNGFYGLHIDNDIWFNYAPAKGLVKATYPVLVTKHSIYYERRVFKNALWFAVGFDLRYNYINHRPYYEPLTGAFYPTSVTLKSFPVLDFFVNLKVKTVRIFLKVDNISSSFGPRGYYSLYAYPASDISFRVGLIWRFFE